MKRAYSSKIGLAAAGLVGLLSGCESVMPAQHQDPLDDPAVRAQILYPSVEDYNSQRRLELQVIVNDTLSTYRSFIQPYEDRDFPNQAQNWERWLGEYIPKFDNYNLADIPQEHSGDLAKAFNDYGWALKERGHNSRAMAVLNDAIRLDATLPAAYLNRAGVHYNNGDLRSALGDLQRARELAPENEVILNSIRNLERELATRRTK